MQKPMDKSKWLLSGNSIFNIIIDRKNSRTNGNIPRWFQKGQCHQFGGLQLSLLQGLQQLDQYPLQLDQLQLLQSSYICTFSYYDGHLKRNLQVINGTIGLPALANNESVEQQGCSVKVRCLTVFSYSTKILVPAWCKSYGMIIIPKDAKNWKTLSHSNIPSH